MFIRVLFGVRVEPYCAHGRCYGFRESLRGGHACNVTRYLELRLRLVWRVFSFGAGLWGASGVREQRLWPMSMVSMV